MAYIKVQQIETGKTGMMPEEKFDPNRYKFVGQQVEPEKTKKSGLSGLLPAVGGIVGGIGGGLVGGIPGAIAGAGLLQGAGEAIREKVSGEDINAGKIGKEALFGAGGELTGIGAAKLLGGAGKLIKGVGKTFGESLEKSVILPQVKAGPKMFSEAEDIMNIARKHGLEKLSSSQASKTIDDIYSQSGKNVKSLVLKNKSKPSVGLIQQVINEGIPEISDLSSGTSKAINNRIQKRLIESKTNEDLLNLKFDLQKEISKTYDPKHISTEQELIKKLYHDNIDEYLKRNIPGIEENLKIMSDMYKISPGIKKSVDISKKGIKLPVVGQVGGETAGQALQKAKVLSSKGLSSIGKSQGINLKTLPPIVQSGIQLTRIPQGETTETQMPIQQKITEQQNQYITGYSPEKLYQGYIKALKEGNKSAASSLYKMYTDESKYQSSKGGKMTEKQASFKSASEGAKYALNLLESGDVSTGLGQKTIGAIGEKLGTISPKQQDYRATIASIRTVIRNAMLGANMTPKEFESLGAFIPEFNDAPSIAKQKLKTFIRESQRMSGMNIQLPGQITNELPQIE